VARKVEIPRPEKPLFPDGTTKAELAGYYERIAPAMLRHLADRPLNLERYPDGIDGPRLWQQQAAGHFPDWIRRVEVPKEGGTVEHVVARDAATLVYLAGQACITPHCWLSRADRLDRPDRLVVDLDPTAEDPDAVREAALALGALVRDIGLEPFAMTTGSRGYHVVAPLQRRQDFDAVRSFSRELARVAADRDPERLTVQQRKAKREGKIFLDVNRNGYAQTTVAPYSVRARPDAPVATPLRWEELEDRRTRPDAWTLRTVPDRVERDGDPWAELPSAARPLSGAARKLRSLSG
jgi:bifunctional non-homologous end joining protein LigD